MGGPFWRGKDAAAWSIPKGTFTEEEEPLAAARREFAEEIGRPAPEVDYRELGAFRYSSGKLVWVFAGESDFDPSEVRSNTFEIEWPPRSGRRQEFPEIDAAGWFTLDAARERLVKGQRPALDALARVVR
jgi:predicted NUDIX family NTP pyrophosphohydrolase